MRNDIGRANQQWVDEYSYLPGNEVLEAFVSVTQQRLDDLRTLTPEDWVREGFTPEGPGPYRQFMEIRAFDCWYHDQDTCARRLLRPGFIEGPVADMSIGRIGPKGMGYVVGKKAGAPPDSTVVFDVAGAPTITVVVSVPPEGRAVVGGDVPAQPTTATALDRRTYGADWPRVVVGPAPTRAPTVQ